MNGIEMHSVVALVEDLPEEGFNRALKELSLIYEAEGAEPSPLFGQGRGRIGRGEFLTPDRQLADPGPTGPPCGSPPGGHDGARQDTVLHGSVLPLG